MSDPNRLPAHFKSLYRLFLRLTSAAVLHHPRASRNLRRRWRPSFDDASRVTREVQKRQAADVGAGQAGIEWLKVWHKRMDNTLEFLYTSAHTRGIPSKVTRALAFSIEEERLRALNKIYSRKAWKPSDPKYASQHLKSLEKHKKQEKFEENSLGALDEIMKMAEANGNLILGTNRVPLGRYVYRRSRR